MNEFNSSRPKQREKKDPILMFNHNFSRNDTATFECHLQNDKRRRLWNSQLKIQKKKKSRFDNGFIAGYFSLAVAIVMQNELAIPFAHFHLNSNVMFIVSAFFFLFWIWNLFRSANNYDSIQYYNHINYAMVFILHTVVVIQFIIRM